MKKAILMIVFLIAVLAAAAIADYKNQLEKIESIESRVEIVESGLSRSNHDASSVQALRGTLQMARDDSMIISDRWVSDRRSALWDRIDRVDQKLKALESRYGAP